MKKLLILLLIVICVFVGMMVAEAREERRTIPVACARAEITDVYSLNPTRGNIRCFQESKNPKSFVDYGCGRMIDRYEEDGCTFIVCEKADEPITILIRLYSPLP